MNGELFRPMTRQDVPEVHEIECACFRTPWSKAALLGELRNDVAHYLVLEQDGKLIGYGGMWVLFEEAHVTNVAILEGYRQSGRGRRLMLAMMERAVRFVTLGIRVTYGYDTRHSDGVLLERTLPALQDRCAIGEYEAF